MARFYRLDVTVERDVPLHLNDIEIALECFAMRYGVVVETGLKDVTEETVALHSRMREEKHG